MYLNRISVLDIGCRYGVFPAFKPFIKELELHMVDAEKEEVERLAKVYNKYKNINIYPAALGEQNREDVFFVGEHKGYSSFYEINKNSIWFKKIRPRESGLKKKLSLQIINGSDFLEKNHIMPEILKLDIEGGELSVLKGLKNNLNSVETIFIESHFDTPYKGGSIFSDTHKFLVSNDFFLSSSEMIRERINSYSIDKDTGIPLGMNCIYNKLSFLKGEVSNPHHLLRRLFHLMICKNSGLFFELLISKYHLLYNVNINDSIFVAPLKKYIGTSFHNFQKTPFHKYEELNDLFKVIFKEDLPSMSAFNENVFYNPLI